MKKLKKYQIVILASLLLAIIVWVSYTVVNAEAHTITFSVVPASEQASSLTQTQVGNPDNPLSSFLQGILDTILSLFGLK